jgi:hypothetical protein
MSSENSEPEPKSPHKPLTTMTMMTTTMMMMMMMMTTTTMAPVATKNDGFIDEPSSEVEEKSPKKSDKEDSQIVDVSQIAQELVERQVRWWQIEQEKEIKVKRECASHIVGSIR